MKAIQRDDGLRIFPEGSREWRVMKRWWGVYADPKKDNSGKQYYHIRSWGIQEFRDFGIELEILDPDAKKDKKFLQEIILGEAVKVVG
jgi:hypothetical protein